jgi:hypothetical protein
VIGRQPLTQIGRQQQLLIHVVGTEGFAHARSLLILRSLSIGFFRQALKGFANYLTLQGLVVILIFLQGWSVRSNHGLKLANAFGVIQTEALPLGALYLVLCILGGSCAIK